MKTWWGKQVLRAIGTGLVVFLTGLLIYDKPPELSAYWLPAVQGAIAFLVAMGINVGTTKLRR